MSAAQVFAGKYVVDDFTPSKGWDGPYHGLDFGFSADPSVLLRLWVFDRRLYIEREAWGLHVELDLLPALLGQIPESHKYVIRADSSRPETISYLQRHGYPLIESAVKGARSVEDGIAHLRGYQQIVVHPSCTHTLEELRLFSYRIDRLSGDILPDLVDRWNHCVDAARYGLEPLIRSQGGDGYFQWIKTQAAGELQTSVDLAKRPGVIVTDLVSPWHNN